jgi:excisionase family DNA binding protein
MDTMGTRADDVLASKHLAHCPQVAHTAEVENVVGKDGTWLTTTEAADVIGCSKSHVIKLFDSGALPGKWVGRHRRILRTVAEDFREGDPREAPGRHAASE